VELGAENKKKVAIAGGLVLALILLLVYQFTSSPSTPSSATAAVNAPGVRPAARRPSRPGKKASALEARLDPTLDLTLLAATEQTKYAGNGRNIFVAGAEPQTPLSNGTTDHKKQQPPAWTPPTTPPPPPITLKFFGFASKPGEPKKIFLSQGEDVFIASEGDIVNRRYKVLRISPNAVDIEDVLYNNRQSIPLTQG
jgi:hypothetical protein